MIISIGDYQICTDTCEVLHKGESQKIEPQVFKLLIFMLNNPERVLSRDELINNVWKSRIISDSALSATICAARHAIGDTGRKQQCIKTVSGSGYRFIAAFVHNEKSAKIHSAPTLKESNHINFGVVDSSKTNPLEFPDKPSIAIMDFEDISPHKDSTLLAYGLTTEITSALARLPHFFVIARASAGIASKSNLSPKEIGRCLGVRYLVYGSLEKVAKRIRITFSIVDAVHDTEIWSDHFDRSLDDIFQVQDDISKAIVLVTDSAIEQAEIERAFLIPTENLSAWENYHRGLWHIDRTSIKDIDAAQGFFKKAIKQDARFARAYAGLSYTHTSRRLLDHSIIQETDESIIKSISYAQQSIDYSKQDSMGYMTLGRVTLYSNNALKALPIFDQSIDLCPNSYHSYILKAQGLSRLENNEKLVHQLLDKGERQNPHCRFTQFNVKMVRAMLMLNQKKYNEATNVIDHSIHYNDHYYISFAIAAASYQLAGNTQKAQQYANQILKLLPHCTTDSCYRAMSYVKEPRDRFIKALLDVGIPAGKALSSDYSS